jgi:hypothetical protein
MQYNWYCGKRHGCNILNLTMKCNVRSGTQKFSRSHLWICWYRGHRVGAIIDTAHIGTVVSLLLRKTSACFKLKQCTNYKKFLYMKQIGVAVLTAPCRMHQVNHENGTFRGCSSAKRASNLEIFQSPIQDLRGGWEKQRINKSIDTVPFNSCLCVNKI